MKVYLTNSHGIPTYLVCFLSYLITVFGIHTYYILLLSCIHIQTYLCTCVHEASHYLCVKMSPLRKPYFHQNMPYTLQNRDMLCSCGKSSYQIGRFECHSSLICNKILVDFCIVYSLLCHFWYLFCP